MVQVQKGFWGDTIPPNEITVNVYHDEREIANNWLYHSFLFVPIQNEEKVLNLLDERRQRNGWKKEMHFKGLGKTGIENRLACEWIDLFGQSLFGEIYFYFFGVNYQNLERTLWKSRQRDFKIYNRFFQIGLYGAIAWFFLRAGFEKVCVQSIFSDKKPRKGEDRFHTQPIEEIEAKSLLKGENIIFAYPKIIEVESDHEKEKDYPSQSHFIQLLDLLMGTFSQIFDNTSDQEGKCMAANKCLRSELPAKLMRPNPNSRYYKRYAVSFFPKRKLTTKQILEGGIIGEVNQFYNKREMKYTTKNQPSLLT